MNRVNTSPADRRRRGLASCAARALAAAALAALLAGCQTTTAENTTGAIPDDYRLRHPIVLKEADRTVQIFVGSYRGGLTPAQRADVLAFANAWRKEATGGIVIDVPSGTKNEVAAAEAVHEANSILAAAGVPPEGVAVRPYSPARLDTLAAIRLSYPRMVAQAGPCGLWPKDLGPTFDREYNENRTWWNFGCAQQQNLAAMVDNPADLVQPRGEDPAYNARRTVVLDKYRKGESTLTAYPNQTTQDPRLSTIGK
jgi:pilus assembly protein CpaD